MKKCASCGLIISDTGSKEFIKHIKKGIESLGYKYDTSICPECNSGKIVKLLIDNGDPVTKETLSKLTKRIYLNDDDTGYKTKLDDIIRGLLKNA